MPDEGTVLLVESDHAESERLGRALENAGYEVITCPGPTAPEYACIGGREATARWSSEPTWSCSIHGWPVMNTGSVRPPMCRSSSM
jgi:hypothetical protein